MAATFFPSIFLLAALLLAGKVICISDGLLENGNFEQGPAMSAMKGTQLMVPNAIPSWVIAGFVEYIEAGHKQGDMLLVVPEGVHAVRLGNEASVRQRLTGLSFGTRYSLTFTAARTCAQAEQLNISAAGQSGILPIQTVYSSSGWDSYAWAFVADATELDVSIHNPGVTEDPACGPLIDSVAIRTLYAPRRTNKNLVKNGDFEEGPYILPNTSWGVLVPSNVADEHSPLPGWMVESLKAIKYLDAQHFAVPEGKRAIELVAGMEGAVAQVIRTVPGRSYVLSFLIGDANDACTGTLTVEAYAGKDSTKVSYESSGKGGSAKRGVLPFVSSKDRTRLVFRSTSYNTRSDDLSSLCGPVLDEVSVVSLRSSRKQL